VRADRLEQVFLRPSSGRLQALIVLESEAGARERVTLSSPTSGVDAAAELAAARYVARWLWNRGGTTAGLVRVRRERGAALEEAREARGELLAELERLGRGRGS
jgi:hypothetical protein